MTSKHEQQKTEKENAQGLPDIANNQPVNFRIFAVCGFVIVLFFIVWLLLGKNEKKEIKHVQDETFEVTPNAPDIGLSRKTTAASASPQKIVNAETTIPAEIKSSSAEQAEKIAEAQKLLKMRLEAPVMLVANSSTIASIDAAKKVSNDPHTQFLNEVSHQESARVQATVLSDRSNLVAEGHLIEATLESAMNTDLPGSLRAVVSMPVYSEDGSIVLIPSGSRLIGQYKSGLLQGQSRIFVVWTRLITPNASISLGSPGIDELGAAGIGADRIDRHFWEMFGRASLLSLIGAGSNNLGAHGTDQPNSINLYRQGVAQSFSDSSNTALQQSAMPPTLHVQQGKVIYVFVAKDLRFDQVAGKLTNAFRIFE